MQRFTNMYSSIHSNRALTIRLRDEAPELVSYVLTSSITNDGRNLTITSLDNGKLLHEGLSYFSALAVLERLAPYITTGRVFFMNKDTGLKIHYVFRKGRLLRV